MFLSSQHAYHQPEKEQNIVPWCLLRTNWLPFEIYVNEYNPPTEVYLATNTKTLCSQHSKAMEQETIWKCFHGQKLPRTPAHRV